MAKKYTRAYARKVAKENTASYFRDMKIAGMSFTKSDVKKHRRSTYKSQVKWNKIYRKLGRR